jgi:hypothetical protein
MGPSSRFLRRFLTVVRKSPFNYIVVIGMVVAPAVALIATDDAGGTPFVLTAIGLAFTLGGNAVVSNRIAEPNYDRMLAWDPDHMPEEWEAVRRSYFKLNWIRALSTWAAFGLFLAALVDLLQGPDRLIRSTHWLAVASSTSCACSAIRSSSVVARRTCHRSPNTSPGPDRAQNIRLTGDLRALRAHPR